VVAQIGCCAAIYDARHERDAPFYPDVQASAAWRSCHPGWHQMRDSGWLLSVTPAR
jgi:hypothetical protein